MANNITIVMMTTQNLATTASTANNGYGYITYSGANGAIANVSSIIQFTQTLYPSAPQAINFNWWWYALAPLQKTAQPAINKWTTFPKIP
jgi:hypothetical protein